MIKEPTVIINGTTLNTGQAMTLRVAVENWFMELRDDPGRLGMDDHARRMREGYLGALYQIIGMIAEQAGP